MAKQIGNTDLIDTWASEGNIVDPDLSKKEEGWLLGEQPPHEWMNHIQNEHGQKINRLLDDTYNEETGLNRRVIYVDTAADLQALDTSGLVEGQQASVGEAGMFVWSGSEWLPKNSETIIVRIPSDYPTLQEAIDTLSNFKTAQGVIIDLLIESGHDPDSGIIVSNGDYGHFRISSEDPVVFLSSSFPDVDFLRAVFAVAPEINCLIDANGRGLSGCYFHRASRGRVRADCGVRNAQEHGLVAYDSSNVSANNSIFSGASQAGNFSGILAWASAISANGADASGSGQYGAQAAASGTLNFRGGNADGAGRHGIRATNSGFVNAREASAQNCESTGIRAYDSGIVHAVGVNVDGSSVGLLARNGGLLVATGGSVKNTSSFAIYAYDGGRIVCLDAEIDTDGTSIVALAGGEVIADRSFIRSGGGRCISTVNGKVSANDSEIISVGTDDCVRAVEGSRVTFTRSSVEYTEGLLIDSRNGSYVSATNLDVVSKSDNSFDILGGSFISASFGGFDASDTERSVNSLGTRGVIFV